MVETREFPAVAALRIARELQDAAGGSERVSLALAGGSTPRPVYEALARLKGLPWDGVEVFFGDERAVPPHHPDSNYRMARIALLDRVPVAGSRIHRMEAERADLEASARDYERLLPESLDVLLLGIGRDGHTASLFPGSPAVREVERTVVPVSGPAEPPGRMTVTPLVIANAARVVVLARGEEKAEAVARALDSSEDPAECPARLARDRTWILDSAAASRLGGPREKSR